MGHRLITALIVLNIMNHTTKRSLASAAMYALLVVSLILFCIAGWRLPRAFLDSLQITVEFSDAL